MPVRRDPHQNRPQADFFNEIGSEAVVKLSSGMCQELQFEVAGPRAHDSPRQLTAPHARCVRLLGFENSVTAPMPAMHTAMTRSDALPPP